MSWLRRLFSRSRLERQLDSELQFHLEEQIGQYVSSGMTEEEARRRARQRFGGLDQIKEECRHVRGLTLVETTMKDLRYTLRGLYKARIFTGVVVLSLALGIGANTAIFSIANALLFDTLRAREPNRLLRINTGASDCSYPNYEDFRAQNTVFEGLLAYRSSSALLQIGTETESIVMEAVSDNYFSVLDIRAASGRIFAAEEYRNPVVVLSHQLWITRFGGDPAVLERPVTLNGRQFLVVGVTPQDFRGARPFALTDVWVPLGVLGENRDRGIQSVQLLGRLNRGVSPTQAQTEISHIAQRLEGDYPDVNEGLGRTEVYRVSGISSFRAGRFSAPVLIFLGVLVILAILVLLIACANVANLLLSRAVTRRREVILRLAIGASRGRLIRQFLTESLLLAFAGSAVALLFVAFIGAAVGAIRRALPIASALDFGLDGRVFAFTLLLGTAVGILFGVIPALHVSRTDLNTKESSDSILLLGSVSFRNVLVVGQVALSLVLIVCAGLSLRSLRNAQTLNLGFDAERVLLVTVRLSTERPDQTNRFNLLSERLVEHLSRLPEIESASIASIVPLTLDSTRMPALIQGIEPAPMVERNTVAPSYFQTLGIPILRGRDFTLEDREGAPAVAIINQTMAERFWPGQDPIGQQFRAKPSDALMSQVVGVVRDSKYTTIGEDPKPFLYLPFFQNRQNTDRPMKVMLRLKTDPLMKMEFIRENIQGFEKVPVSIEPLNEAASIALLPARFSATLLGTLGLIGLVLAAVGVYGVVVYSVTQRTREFGLRIALGAQRSDIWKVALSRGLCLTLIGLAFGLMGATAASRLLAGSLVGLSTLDPATYLGAFLVVLAVASVANVVPAHRATRVDPTESLRHE